jgi:hypothetical protein
MRTLLIPFGAAEPGSNSLFAHSVQENVSPTYADPNAGGSVRSGERMKESFLGEGYARDAEGVGKVEGDPPGEGDGVGRGCCIEREGRESLLNQQVSSRRDGASTGGLSVTRNVVL